MTRMIIDPARDRELLQRSTLERFRTSVSSLIKVSNSINIWQRVEVGMTAGIFAYNFSKGDGMASFFLKSFSKSDVERVTKERLLLATQLRMGDARKRLPEHKMMSESIRTEFEGETVLDAFVLSFGYPVEDVLSLSADEVTRYYDSALRVHPQRVEWETLVKLAHIDVDSSLLSSFLGPQSNSGGMETGGIQ